MKKKDFMNILELAKHNEIGIAVAISMPWLPSEEIIINPPENVQEKIDYYQQAYDDDMKLNMNENIRVIGAFGVEGEKFDFIYESLTNN